MVGKRALAEQIRVTLAGLRKLDDFIGEVRENGMGGIGNAESRPCQLERDAHDEAWDTGHCRAVRRQSIDGTAHQPPFRRRKRRRRIAARGAK
jgi:hypothetical protein